MDSDSLLHAGSRKSFARKNLRSPWGSGKVVTGLICGRQICRLTTSALTQAIDLSRMLKKSLFSPAQPWRLLHPPALRLPRQPLYPGTRLSPGGVLASLRGSTYRGEPLGDRNHWRGFSVRQDQFKGRTAHTKCGLDLLASSLAAALHGIRRASARQGWAGEKSSLFEHPACPHDS